MYQSCRILSPVCLANCTTTTLMRLLFTSQVPNILRIRYGCCSWNPLTPPLKVDGDLHTNNVATLVSRSLFWRKSSIPLVLPVGLEPTRFRNWFWISIVYQFRQGSLLPATMTGVRRSSLWQEAKVRRFQSLRRFNPLRRASERSYYYERNLVADIGFEPMNVRVKVVCLTTWLIRNI